MCLDQLENCEEDEDNETDMVMNLDKKVDRVEDSVDFSEIKSIDFNENLNEQLKQDTVLPLLDDHSSS